MSTTTPLPPPELMYRVGHQPDAGDLTGEFEEGGRVTRQWVLDSVPPGWSPEGRRLLDFGCGAGRTLRHFVRDGPAQLELWGCDIDPASVDWVNSHLTPRVHAFHNDAEPPLDLPDKFFDLVLAASVFTHIVEYWSAWLLELRRVLKPDGLLVASFMGGGVFEWALGDTWQEDRVGMNVRRPAATWREGGPLVFHSEWWIREHWGRAFEIVSLAPGDSNGHGLVVMRPRPGKLSIEDLEHVDPAEHREVVALQHNVAELCGELAQLRAERDAAVSDRDRLAVSPAEVTTSRSWRLIEPLCRRRRAVRSKLPR